MAKDSAPEKEGELSKYRWTLRTLFVITTIVCAVGGGWQCVVVPARQRAKTMSCRNNVKFLLLALGNYHDVNECFPADYDRASSNGRKHSWRVALSPYFGTNDFVPQYDWSQPWDDPGNQLLGSYYQYNCPCHEDGPTTNYVAVSGPGTAFPDKGVVTLDGITDGTANTIIFVEINGSDINWLEPRDLRIDEMSFQINDRTKPSISSQHHRGPHVGFADGEVFQVSEDISPETLRALVTIAGGEDVSRQRLVDDGLLR